MVRVAEVFILNRDLRAFRRRVEWLDQRIAERKEAGAPYGFYSEEREAFARLLSQVETKGVDLADSPGPSKDAVDARRLRRLGWHVKYTGHSNPKPWTAMRSSSVGKMMVEHIEAETFAELERLGGVQ